MRNVYAFLLLFVWLCLGAWFYTCKVKNLCSDASSEAIVNESTSTIINPAHLKSAYAAVFKTEDGLFLQKSSTEISQSDTVIEGLDTIAQFLIRYPETEVTIIGHYTDDEINPSNSDNIGLARAEGIQQLLVDKGVNLAQVNIVSRQKEDLFATGEMVSQDSLIDFKFSEKYEELNHIDVKAAYQALLTVGQDMEFNRDGVDVTVYESAMQRMEAIRFYLNANKDQSLQIIMPFTEEELLVDGFEDIGEAKGENLKEQLAAFGVGSDRISVISENTIDIFHENGVALPRTIDFNFIFPDKTDDAKIAEMDLERNLENALNNEPIEATEVEPEIATTTEEVEVEEPIDDSNTTTTSNASADTEDYTTDYASNSDHPNINFDYMSVRLNLNDDITNYLEELKNLLDNNPETEVLVKGHADSSGTDDFNYKMGYQRARQTKLLMLRKGINREQIKIMSEGEKYPIASNVDSEGRRQNRRVEIDIR